MDKLILIKYGELTTKKQNRKLFIQTLKQNIKNILKDEPITITSDLVRMYISVKDTDLKLVQNKLLKVFGIHRIVICNKVKTDTDSIKESVLNILKDKTFSTFKVNTNRAYKPFPISSMEFNNLIGSLVLSNFDTKVDVHNPELMINIEIRESFTYIYTNKDEIKGIGGYPVGVQGKGLLMLSGGIDSPVAGYLSMKRGIQIECIYFDSPPHTSINAKNKVIKLASILNDYGKVIVHVAHFTKIQEAIYKEVPNEYMITIMRRMMYRISERLAKKRKCKIIINGESIGQVASQTIVSMSVINNVTNMPVIRPVACFDKLEIIDLSRQIGTYDTSILPYEDCCTIFLPKHPVINPNLERSITYENSFDYESLIQECIENIETITILKEKEFSDLL